MIGGLTGIAVRFEDLQLGGAIGVADLETHQEPVELGFRQGVGSFVLDRVLRGDHHEGRHQLVRDAVGRDLPLGHGLEESGLGLGRCPVDFVGQQHVAEHRTRAELEGVRSSVPDTHSGDVGREEVGGELHSTESAVDAASQCFTQAGLADTGDVLDQNVAVGDQGQRHEVDHGALALDHCGDVGGKRGEVDGEIRACSVRAFGVGFTCRLIGCRHAASTIGTAESA